MTKYETIAQTIIIIFAGIFLFVPQQALNDWEYAYLFCFVMPLMLFVIFDPERLKRKGE